MTGLIDLQSIEPIHSLRRELLTWAASPAEPLGPIADRVSAALEELRGPNCEEKRSWLLAELHTLAAPSRAPSLRESPREAWSPADQTRVFFVVGAAYGFLGEVRAGGRWVLVVMVSKDDRGWRAIVPAVDQCGQDEPRSPCRGEGSTAEEAIGKAKAAAVRALALELLASPAARAPSPRAFALRWLVEEGARELADGFEAGLAMRPNVDALFAVEYGSALP